MELDELARVLSKRTKVRLGDTRALLRALPDTFLGFLLAGFEIDLPRLGRLFPYVRSARSIYSVATGRRVHVPVRLSCKFKFRVRFLRKLFEASRGELPKYELRFPDEGGAVHPGCAQKAVRGKRRIAKGA